MRLLFKILLIACMAIYSFNLNSEIVKVRKGIQPVSPKQPKKSKTKQTLEKESEHEQEHECEKEKVLCQK